MPGVNEAISAAINMGGDFLTSVINSQIASVAAYNVGGGLGGVGTWRRRRHLLSSMQQHPHSRAADAAPAPKEAAASMSGDETLMPSTSMAAAAPCGSAAEHAAVPLHRLSAIARGSHSASTAAPKPEDAAEFPATLRICQWSSPWKTCDWLEQNQWKVNSAEPVAASMCRTAHHVRSAT